ncbi:MAG: transporter substrate-binding domain-containing protein, partial [Gammaproteobacteria bacterium]|nr:transporter substrate-binding domain-containing protein [Gammaproteobacteria bacterium]
MRRLLQTVITLAMLALPLAPGPATAQQIWWEPGLIEHVRFRALLRVGVGMFEPWVMCDRSGGLIGYEIDLARRLAEDLGVRVEFVRMNWQYIIPALVDGRFDVIVSGMSITPARSLQVNFSEPYSQFGTAIVANIGLTPGSASAEYFNRADVIFAVRRGTTAEALVKREFPEAMLLSFDTDAEVVDAVTSAAAHAT